MSKIIIITQMVDSNDNHRAFFIDWIKEFAKKYEKVEVITVGKGDYHLPSNVSVYSLGKEQSISKFIQAVRFFKHLIKIVPKADGIFAHASPIFVIASWPVAFLFRKKIILWYLHRALTFKLKIAEMMSYKIVTARRASLTLLSTKIVETGHGIDVENFNTDRSWDSNSLKILSVGRISKIKNFETIIRATKILKDQGMSVELSIVGEPVMDNDHQYLEELIKMVSELGLSNEVKFLGFVPYNQMSQYYSQNDFFVGALPFGGIDKAMLEAMASGEITLTSNEAFQEYFGDYGGSLLFKHNNSADLAEKIINLNNADRVFKKNISDFLHKSVKDHHNLKRLIDKIYGLVLSNV